MIVILVIRIHDLYVMKKSNSPKQKLEKAICVATFPSIRSLY